MLIHILIKIKNLDCIVYNFDNSLKKKTSFQKSKINQWKKSFEINFFQPIELVHVFYSVLKKSRSASVINISSLLSSFGGHPNMYQHGIAKLALDNFTKYVWDTCWYNDVLLSHEFAELNIIIKPVEYFGITGDK